MAFQHNESDLMNSVLLSSDEVKHNFIPDFGTCIECGEERINEGWCKDCEINAFKVNFENWTSGNPNIDNFIKHTQLNATGNVDYLEYIEFEQFDLIENTNKVGSFSTLYSAIWMEGPRWNWDEDAEQFSRVGPVKVALKRLNNSRDMSEEYLKKIYKYHSCLQSEGVADFFGVTKDPTSNYMFVMRYYENGDLYSYIEETQGMLCWRDIVNIIWEISGGIEFLHNNGFIHGNLHGGNLLIENEPDTINTYISDLGLIGPANKRNSTEIYGVLPYIDPEILKGNSPTKSSDVYSFGIIMWTLSAGIRPLCNRAHDLRLATEICLGLRPEIIDGAPNVYIQLMKRCWHPDPSKRPTASQICDLLGTWVSAICDDPDPSDLSDQFDLAEEKKILRYGNE